MQKITTFLWFDDNAEEAVDFYTSVFGNSKVNNTTRYTEESAKASGRPIGSVMTVAFSLHGQPFTAINGGPAFKFNPSVSFFIYCKTENEIEELWNKLSEDGKILMALDKYPFSEKYGWLEDKFGVSWQIIISTMEIEQKIVPSLMFTKNVTGKAEEAINFYTSVFSQNDVSANNSKAVNFFKYEAGQAPDEDSKIAYADFTLGGQKFAAMDGGHMHDFAYNEAISFVVNCKDQTELDHFWNKLSEGGDPKAQMCGWLKDKYGLSWQIVPDNLSDLLSGKEPGKSRRVMQKVLQMKKLDIDTLKRA